MDDRNDYKSLVNDNINSVNDNITQSNDICDYCERIYTNIECKDCESIDGYPGFKGKKVREL